MAPKANTSVKRQAKEPAVAGKAAKNSKTAPSSKTGDKASTKPATKSSAKTTALKKVAAKDTAPSHTKVTTRETKTTGDASTNAAKPSSRKKKGDNEAPTAPSETEIATTKPQTAENKASTEETVVKTAATKAKTAKTKAATKEENTPATTTTTSNARARKRKAETPEVSAAPPAKKAKPLQKGEVINEPPTQRLNVYVFGEGTAGELGLGTAKNAVDVKRPRLNPHLAADKVGVVQIVAGGMHVVALTHDNKILTWGVNDQGALGRDTTWEGGLRDADAPESEESDDEDDNGLNPRESMPGEVDFSSTDLAEGTRWVHVAAGDSCSFAVTDDGRVYGWGTFRSNEGPFGFNTTVETARRPLLIPELKKIKQVVAGANHALAIDTAGSVFAWGSGQQNQLGRKVVERTKKEGLIPRQFGLPKGKNGIVAIETGSYHSFAVAKNGDVYGWGLNNFGETGIPDRAGEDEAFILKPRIIEGLKGKKVISIKGGGHHSLCATEEGECLVWGRCDSAQAGIAIEEIRALPEGVVRYDDRDAPRMILQPTKVTAIKGEVACVASNSDHNVVVTKEGKAWSWGFSGNYQTGLGVVDDVKVATMIDNTAVREKKLNHSTSGGQFSILTSVAEL